MLEYESIFRLASFVLIFVLMAILQRWRPRREMLLGLHRWPANLGGVLLDTLAVRLLFAVLQYLALPAGAIAVALWAQSYHIGILNMLMLPAVVHVLIAIILLDLAIYLQHRVFHALPVLWRLHRVHHSDLEFDVTTAVRFHPLEILLSMLIKMAVVVLLGAPAVAVLLFEVILNGMAMFNHANFRLPIKLDGWLRRLLVTPDVHRIHHSTLNHELNSNFGFNLIVWDRLFGTCRANPELGHTSMSIGLEGWQQSPTHHLGWMLRLPWLKK